MDLRKELVEGLQDCYRSPSNRWEIKGWVDNRAAWLSWGLKGEDYSLGLLAIDPSLPDLYSYYRDCIYKLLSLEEESVPESKIPNSFDMPCGILDSKVYIGAIHSRLYKHLGAWLFN